MDLKTIHEKEPIPDTGGLVKNLKLDNSGTLEETKYYCSAKRMWP